MTDDLHARVLARFVTVNGDHPMTAADDAYVNTYFVPLTTLPVDADEIDSLTAHLERLARDPELRARMGRAARALAEREHDVGRVADAYARTLEEAAGGRAVRNAVQTAVAHAAAEVGLQPGGEALGEISARLREAGRGD